MLDFEVWATFELWAIFNYGLFRILNFLKFLGNVGPWTALHNILFSISGYFFKKFALFLDFGFFKVWHFKFLEFL